jgi:hypothetical protein
MSLSPHVLPPEAASDRVDGGRRVPFNGPTEVSFLPPLHTILRRASKARGRGLSQDDGFHEGLNPSYRVLCRRLQHCSAMEYDCNGFDWELPA